MRKFNNITYELKKYPNLEGNFTQISNDVYKITTSNEFKVYCYLCMRYNSNLKYAFPSIRTMSDDCNISIPTVNKSLKQLEDKGLIKKLKYEEKTTQYANNIYIIYYPVISKNSLEEDREKELEEMIKKADEEILNKIRTIDLEINEDSSDYDE